MVHVRKGDEDCVDVVGVLHDARSELGEFGDVKAAVQEEGILVDFEEVADSCTGV